MPSSKTAAKRKRDAPSRSKASQHLQQRGNGAQTGPAIRSHGRRAQTPFFKVPPDPSIVNLQKIENIVVLMMENRSFDHMLGYLSLEGKRKDIDGLTPGLANTYQGHSYGIRHLTSTKLGANQDPCHKGICVANQVQNKNGGFVQNYAATHPSDPDPGLVMGYYNAADVPTYDYLASQFCVCDKWFASVPGETWPNRLYALAGRAAGSKDNMLIPRYNLPSFVRHLDNANVRWRWYGYRELPFSLYTTLQITDHQYNDPSSGDYQKVNSRFFDDAARGTLAPVSWIDPSFGIVYRTEQNDDHPPTDIIKGQELALKVYHAVTQSPQWKQTLLLIVYDEHGGFYDHVVPGAAADDDPNFRSYGMRVPAMVISPFVRRKTVSGTRFDHTSIIKTILLRFCRQSNGNIPDMGARTNAANHLGSLLTEPKARAAPSVAGYQHVIDQLAAWHTHNFKAAFQQVGVRTEGEPQHLTEFQQGLLAANIRRMA